MRWLVACALLVVATACDEPDLRAPAGGASVVRAPTMATTTVPSVASSSRPARSAAPSASVSASALREAAVARIAAKARKLVRQRYMEQSCRRARRRGWEGFPLRRCRYQVADARGHRSAEVIMLNPAAEQLARWVVTSCDAASGDADGDADACADALYQRLLLHSGAQFPVAGIVLEDLRPRDGHYEMYCFRDGVRVEVAGFVTASTDEPDRSRLKRCLEGEVVGVSPFARLQGTTPSEYRAGGGEVEVGDDATPNSGWLDVSRDSYQAAWSSEHNELMAAWVKSNL